MTKLTVLLFAGMLSFAGQAAQKPAPAPPAAAKAGALPVIVLDTDKGQIEIELFQKEAPKSVEHVLALVKKGFYRGLRFHRVESSLVQVGDPLTKNMTYRASWGTGGSGEPIGVAEISPEHTNVRGAVGMAYSGSAKNADSQFYILKRAAASLDGKYAVIGHVTKGMAVVDQLEVPDILKLVTIK
jgi:cyclophilin family peptidyl-prolyl cis-trans isomerase